MQRQLNSVKIDSADPSVKRDWERQRREALSLIDKFKSTQNCYDIQMLADDVGLGKTYVSMIVTSEFLWNKKQSGNVLIIAPNKEVASKWKENFEDFRKYLKNPEQYNVHRLRNLGEFPGPGSNNFLWLRKIDESNKECLVFFATCILKSRFHVIKNRERFPEKDIEDIITWAKKIRNKYVEVAKNCDQIISKSTADELMEELYRSVYDPDRKVFLHGEFADPKTKIQQKRIGEKRYLRLQFMRELREFLPKRIELSGKLKNYSKRFVKTSLRYNKLKDKEVINTNKTHHNVYIVDFGFIKACKNLTSNDDIYENKIKNFKADLAIVDEVHNWKKLKYGAKQFQHLFSERCDKKLLLTATPIQLHVDELITIFKSVLPDLNVESKSPGQLPVLNVESKSLAQIIKCKEKWNEALEKNNQVLKCLKSLNDQDCMLLQNKYREPSGWHVLTAQKRYTAQIKNWETIKANESANLKNLAEAILNLNSILRNGLSQELNEVILRCRKAKNRAYFCGCDYDSDFSDNKHEMFHDNFYKTNGINASCSIYELMAMRVESIIRRNNPNRDVNNRSSSGARLVLGYYSSFPAFKNSAQGEILKKRPHPLQNEADDKYVKEFERLIANKSKIKHTKVEATVNRAVHNLIHGKEKTLIFCERVETVNHLAETVKCVIDSKFCELFNKKQLQTKLLSIKIEHKGQSIIRNETRRVLRDCLKKSDRKNNLPVEITIPNKESRQDYDAFIPAVIAWSLDGINYRCRQKYDAKKMLIKAWCKSDYNSNDHRFKSVVVPISGRSGGTNEKRKKIITNFNSESLPSILICSPIGQEGIDLHRFCRQIVLHDLNWNPAKLEQRIGRVDRIGSLAQIKKKPVEIRVPFIDKGYDAYMYNVILSRIVTQELVLGNQDLSCAFKDIDLEKKRECQDESSNDEGPLIGWLIEDLFQMDLSRGTDKKNK